MNNIPYSKIKENTRAYDIMLLRDQQGTSYADIARAYNLSAIRIVQIYHKLKFRQIRLYIQHITFTLGHENIAEIRDEYTLAYDCYQDRTYACAYLENTYKTILTAYRNGEPGMPEPFMKSLPPFKRKFSQKTTSRIIKMREVERKSFIAIAKELRITRAKAIQLYDWFYHERIMAIIQLLQEKAETQEEKHAIRSCYFHSSLSAKKYYDLLTNG